MSNTNEKEYKAAAVLVDISLEKIKQALDEIAIQIDKEKRTTNTNIWLKLDFEKVKERINKITEQLAEVQIDVESDSDRSNSD